LNRGRRRKAGGARPHAFVCSNNKREKRGKADVVVNDAAQRRKGGGAGGECVSMDDLHAIQQGKKEKKSVQPGLSASPGGGKGEGRWRNRKSRPSPP